MTSLLFGQDPVINSSNYKDLPPIPRAILEPPPLPTIKTSPKDLRRKARVTQNRKKRPTKKSTISKKSPPQPKAKVAR